MTEKQDGALCKIVEIDGVTFPIYYGYQSDGERLRGWEPTPQYPDFRREPRYTADGFPFVTVDQDVCEQFAPKPEISSEGWCNDCRDLERCEEFIGLCRCPKNRLPQVGAENANFSLEGTK